MATKPPAPSSDHDETVILKAPVVGTRPDPFDSDKTVVRRTPAAEPFVPKPKGFSMSFDHPEADDLEATVKVAPLRAMPGASGPSATDPLTKRKPGAEMPQVASAEAAPAKGGVLKWILGGAAAIVVIILGVAYLLGSNELAAPKVTILKQGTLIEGVATPMAASPSPTPEPAPVVAVAPAPAPAAANPPAPPTLPAAPAVATPVAPKAAAPTPTPAATAAAAAAKKAALEQERLAKQAQTSAPIVSQAPPPPVQAAPAAPAPVPVAAPRVEAPPVPVAPPPPAAPSNPNQMCEGRLLFALQNCLTEQCAKPAFSKHLVCVERREMEQRRQERQQGQ